MHDSETSRDVELSSKKLNGTRNSDIFKNPAAPVHRERNITEHGAPGFFNFFELRVPLRFFEIARHHVMFLNRA